jgi:hypothetical protein
MESVTEHPSHRLHRHPGGEIQLRVPELRQLFDPMDPSPPANKDLHPNVEEFIVSWGSEVSAKTPLSLLIHLEKPAGDEDQRNAIAAIRAFFDQRGQVTGRQLRKLFRLGRVSLVIALAVLALSLAAGEFLLSGTDDSGVRRALGGTLEIGGWVAMWRPLETFLYDWWPLMGDIRLFRRMAAMPVRIATGSPRENLPT